MVILLLEECISGKYVIGKVVDNSSIIPIDFCIV